MKTKSATIIIFLVALMDLFAQTESSTDKLFISKIDSALSKLIQMRLEIREIHPLLENLQPVAVVKADQLFIFDLDTVDGNYKFIKKEPVPFPMPEGIKASFPLSSYNSRPTCVVTEEIFKTPGGYATIFHEFIHCSQANTVEFQLKMKLQIQQEAIKNKNYSWEINHSFPYDDSVFIAEYSGFMGALINNDLKAITQSRAALKEKLSPINYEYMIWEEWKEGFARLIENKIRKHYGLKENNYGKEKPFNRAVFYCGGEGLIGYLTLSNKGLYLNMEKLFEAMSGPGLVKK